MNATKLAEYIGRAGDMQTSEELRVHLGLRVLHVVVRDAREIDGDLQLYVHAVPFPVMAWVRASRVTLR